MLRLDKLSLNANKTELSLNQTTQFYLSSCVLLQVKREPINWAHEIKYPGGNERRNLTLNEQYTNLKRKKGDFLRLANQDG